METNGSKRKRERGQMVLRSALPEREDSWTEKGPRERRKKTFVNKT